MAALGDPEALSQEPDDFREVLLDLLSIVHFTYTSALSDFEDPIKAKESFYNQLSTSQICKKFGIVGLLNKIDFSKFTKKEDVFAFLQVQTFFGSVDDGLLKSSGLGKLENFKIQDVASALFDVTFDTWLTVDQKKECALKFIEQLPEKNKKELFLLLLSDAVSNKNDQAIHFWMKIVSNEDVGVFGDFLKENYKLRPQKFPVNLSSYLAAHGLLESLSFLLGKGHFNSALDENKISPLGHAASNGRFEVVDFLLNKNYVEAANEVSPLYLSMNFGFDEISERLIERSIGLKYSKFEYDNRLDRLYNSFSLLDYACFLDKPKILSLMLKKGYHASKGFSFFDGDYFANPMKLLMFRFDKTGDSKVYIDMVLAYARHNKIIPKVSMPNKKVNHEALALNQNDEGAAPEAGTLLAHAVATGDLDFVQRTLNSIKAIYDENNGKVDENNFSNGESSSCSTVVSECSNFEQNKLHETYVSWCSSFKKALSELNKLLFKFARKNFSFGPGRTSNQHVFSVKNSNANLNPWLQKHLNAQRLISEGNSSVKLGLVYCAKKIAPSLCQGPKSWAWIRNVLDKQRFSVSPLMLAFELGQAPIAKLLLQYEELDGDALVKNLETYKSLIQKHQSARQNDPSWTQEWQELEIALDARVRSQNLEAIDSQAS